MNGWKVKDELERSWKVAVMGKLLGTIAAFVWRDWEKPQRTSVRVAGLRVDLNPGFLENEGEVLTIWPLYSVCSVKLVTCCDLWIWEDRPMKNWVLAFCEVVLLGYTSIYLERLNKINKHSLLWIDNFQSQFRTHEFPCWKHVRWPLSHDVHFCLAVLLNFFTFTLKIFYNSRVFFRDPYHLHISLNPIAGRHVVLTTPLT
jgi:hypothetical protein